MKRVLVFGGIAVLSFFCAAPSWAQLEGTDNTPGTPCTRKGAVQMTANASGPGAYILTCDGNAPSGKWVATLNAALPTASAQVANKQYVDTAVASVSGGGSAGTACVYSATGCFSPFLTTGMQAIISGPFAGYGHQVCCLDPAHTAAVTCVLSSNQCSSPFVDTGMASVSGTNSDNSFYPDQKICCKGSGLVNVTPTVFNFTDRTNVRDMELLESNIVTISGISIGSAEVGISSGSSEATFSIGGGPWVRIGRISNGQTLRVRIRSAPNPSQKYETKVWVGGYFTTWKVTTSPTVCPTPGNTCVDGTKYAGVLNGTRLYTTPADQGTYHQWKTSTGTIDAGSSYDDGRANSANVPNSTVFPAFKACKDLGSAWYLPAVNELGVLMASGVGGFTNTYYWTSTEIGTNQASILQYPNGGTNGPKTNTFKVRCARR